MRIVTADEIERALSYPELVDIVEAQFRAGAISPTRHHHTIELEGRPAATLLLMPAWAASAAGATTAGPYAGVKLVTVFPDNGRLGKPAVQGAYLLLSTETGEPLALLDAPRLTVWRTAAASAMASRRLARPDTKHMLLIGAGALGPYLVRAHASVLPIETVTIWNRTAENAVKAKSALVAAGLDIDVDVTADLEGAVRSAELISTATLSSEPLVRGAWLSPGTHVDCVGAFRPDMREADDDVITRARVYVDTRAGALHEAGDIVAPLRAGLIAQSDIRGDLYDLARGTVEGRSSAHEITFFKSVGASLEDLAAAVAVYQRLRLG